MVGSGLRNFRGQPLLAIDELGDDRVPVSIRVVKEEAIGVGRMPGHPKQPALTLIRHPIGDVEELLRSVLGQHPYLSVFREDEVLAVGRTEREQHRERQPEGDLGIGQACQFGQRGRSCGVVGALWSWWSSPWYSGL